MEHAVASENTTCSTGGSSTEMNQSEKDALTKMKLGFIDGSFPQLAIGSPNFEQWRRVDLIFTSWIWNSISKDIVEAFRYSASSRELWLALQRRYGRSNGPMIFQIERDITSVSQRDLSLTAYLTKLTKLWNELICLVPPPRCTCGACTCGVNKAITDQTASSQLMQFLMVYTKAMTANTVRY
ncbi:UNVERIFIED_CONTAM: hypothetical protein Slati_2190600 [Sesamum latifolium]|uniref:Retrotransposon gag domain-containing protein n=1 Tax=Sesamum latifolium TaxID=2727402 RepID=A0AAW2WRL6_9LAMI